MADLDVKRVQSLGLAPPSAGQAVFRDDCAYCFDTPESEHGLDVCLSCFLATSPAPEHNYTQLHWKSTGHPLFVNIKKTRRLREDSPPKITKLAILAESEEEKFDTATEVKDVENGRVIDKSVGNLQAVVDGVLNATSYSKREEIKAWELDIHPCEHIVGLTQADAPANADLTHCAQCDLVENLWMCLVCENVGCGRAQFGGVGGQSHGLAHYEATGHAASVKLGSITADGSADVFCYLCAEEVEDPNLTNHLHHFGINIAERQKTEKSLTELQLEQNLKWDFSMTDAEGAELLPLFGPGLTGLKNLGNSCYISSVVQCLFALPEFQKRYKQNSTENAASRNPAEDLEVQLNKISDGLLSGRYATPDNYGDSETVRYQKGLSLGMFKSLVGRGHPEFASMRQQDAFEFLGYLVDQIQRSRSGADPTNVFKFQTERRWKCTSCSKVRYKTEPQESLSISVPARETGKNDNGETQYETVPMQTLFDLFSQPEEIEYTCKSCHAKNAETTVKFKTFPDVLVVNARRFQIVNWVPQKLDIPVSLPSDGKISLDSYLSLGPQADEDIAEDDDAEGEAFVPNAEAVATLEAMGFPQVRIEKALHATGNNDAEAAMNWLLEHMDDADIDVPLQAQSAASAQSVSNEQVEMLTAMGFAPQAAQIALKKNSGNVEAAVEWLFANPDPKDDEPAEAQGTEQALGNANLPANYRLKSIICHKGGSVHTGHYVAFVRKEIDGKDEWVLFNDEKVVKGGEVEEMMKFAYVYFFERI